MIDSIDHLVLNVSSIKKAKEFYGDILKLKIIEFKKDRFAIDLGDQKINLHQKQTIATPKAKLPSNGSLDICFISKIPLEEIKKHLQKNQIEIIEFGIKRVGAKSPLYSLYIYDFDGNLIELCNELT